MTQSKQARDPAATVVVGEGDFRYSPDLSWGTLPDGWTLGDVAGVAVDSRGRVYAFNRGEHPLVVFDASGEFQESLREDLFRHPHAIQVAPDDSLLCTDDIDHTVRWLEPSGEVRLQLGKPGRHSEFMSGKPFCRCTDVALGPDGSLYVSDGYGNARVHQYSPTGKLVRSWGGPGAGPGEFNVPHNIGCDATGYVYVADRENHRIQVFSHDGDVVDIWQGFHRPSALFVDDAAGHVYVGEIGPYYAHNRGTPNLGPRITVTDMSGRVLGRVQGDPAAGIGPDQFLSPHAIAKDSAGSLFVGEVSSAAWPMLFPQTPEPSMPRLRKLVSLRTTETTSRT
ncbi:MAG TPA: peptidyl-alpha-hydroxyglycine alpha-amidating lyase family protein [Nocardioides sp.]|uniref:peptidyl-alpha-hydroxyglycine alpha-amidating lyase family protein n=1 Tax=Nocardioides sp. TaxID=35761 RepID=UPI002E31ABE6|nr:peptidyl-alpha-hydroxyglycine alpha-amidating lyase family protein [Nocardioides sp.]HEX3931812.1 peptidyl-alpha-hydroxyglycine alpha-amidating lyase family protein [Nocardioides sp.]